MSMKYLDKTGLTYFWSKIKALLNLKANISDLATVATSGDYEDLSNLPVAGVDYQTPLETEGATELGIDTVVTQNSSNLITSGAVYNAIPTELADLSGDSTHRVVTDSQMSAWSNKQDQTITDSHNYFTATTVEGALDELATRTSGSTIDIVRW